MRRALALVAAAAATSMLWAGAAGAAPAEKVLICHGTASETNPYVLIEVSANSFKDGHFDGGPEVPGHGWQNNPDKLAPAGATSPDACEGWEPPPPN